MPRLEARVSLGSVMSAGSVVQVRNHGMGTEVTGPMLELEASGCLSPLFGLQCLPSPL